MLRTRLVPARRTAQSAHRLARLTTRLMLPALAALALTACGSEADTAQPGTDRSPVSTTTIPSTTPSESPSESATTSPATTTPPSSEPTPDADVTIEATIADGKVSPSTQTVKAKAGQKVRITVTSDVDDEIHVHGYDEEVELKAGRPGSVTFTADTKGTFEIETHESGKLIAKLVVN